MPDHAVTGNSGPRALLEVFAVFLRLGLTSFGGPIAHLGYFRDEFVGRRRWLDEKAYADLVALCQFLPGPASSQVAGLVGWKLLRPDEDTAPAVERVRVSRAVSAAAAVLFFALLALVYLRCLSRCSQQRRPERMGGRVAVPGRDFPALFPARACSPAALGDAATQAQRTIDAGRRECAVVGLLLAALYQPVWTSAIRMPHDLALALVSFLLLVVWRVSPWIIVVLAMLGGAMLSAS